MLDESESSHAVINIALIHIQNNTFFITNSRSLNKCNNYDCIIATIFIYCLGLAPIGFFS